MSRPLQPQAWSLPPLVQLLRRLKRVELNLVFDEEEEPTKPSLVPPTFETTAEPVRESSPGLAKALPRNVIPMRRTA